MAGGSFKMDMSGLEGMVGNAIRHFSNTEELMSSIGETFVSSTKERFEEGVDPDGEPWKVSKRAEKEGGQTLVKDTHLKKSINYEASSQIVAVGTSNDVYGAIHQFSGEDVGKPEIEAREYIGINEDDITEAKGMVSDFMAEGFGR